MEKLLLIGDVAKLLGVSRDTLRRWDKNGRFSTIRRRKKTNNYRYYRQSDVEEFSKTLDGFKLAKKWILRKKGVAPLPCYYCRDSYVFQSRLSRLQKELSEVREIRDFFLSVVAIAGEIGNNSFDHNLGNWPDIPGIFFSWDLNEKKLVLADRGQGILKTLKRVKPGLKSHEKALEIAFTEIISARFPENRGNGLKYVRETVVDSDIKLFFQTGNAYVELKRGEANLNIKSSSIFLKGCLVEIKF